MAKKDKICSLCDSRAQYTAQCFEEWRNSCGVHLGITVRQLIKAAPFSAMREPHVRVRISD